MLVSAQFEGKKLIEKHRIINAALADEMKEIHALSIKNCLSQMVEACIKPINIIPCVWYIQSYYTIFDAIQC